MRKNQIKTEFENSGENTINEEMVENVEENLIENQSIEESDYLDEEFTVSKQILKQYDGA